MLIFKVLNKTETYCLYKITLFGKFHPTVKDYLDEITNTSVFKDQTIFKNIFIYKYGVRIGIAENIIALPIHWRIKPDRFLNSPVERCEMKILNNNQVFYYIYAKNTHQEVCTYLLPFIPNLTKKQSAVINM